MRLEMTMDCLDNDDARTAEGLRHLMHQVEAKVADLDRDPEGALTPQEHYIRVLDRNGNSIGVGLSVRADWHDENGLG